MILILILKTNFAKKTVNLLKKSKMIKINTLVNLIRKKENDFNINFSFLTYFA